MKKCASTVVFILSLLFAVAAWSQDDNVVQSLDGATQDGLPHAHYDDIATPGQIHGFIPDTWTVGMITLADLQTPEGQDWLNGLMAAQSIQDQTRYVCLNPGPTTTSSRSGDFYFYDLPAGSYAIGACMQTPSGHWRSGAQVVSLDAGENELIALGPSGGLLMRAGEPFVAAYYLGLWEPIWFGPAWVWGWHPTLAWQASFYYQAPLYRSAPIWVRPLHVAVGTHLVVPPYKEVIAGNYHYVAFHHGTYVRESPHSGYVVPPKHVFQPVTPAMEVQRAHEAAQKRAAAAANVPVPIAHPQPTSAPRSSQFQSAHPGPGVVNTPQRGAAYHPVVANKSQSHTQNKPSVFDHRPQTASSPSSHDSEAEPRQETHSSPSTQPKPSMPARKH